MPSPSTALRRNLATSALVMALAAGSALATGTATARADARIPASDLGFGAAVDFLGDRDVVVRTIPVPEGLRPEFLEARATMPPDASRGTIDVVHQGAVISRTELTAASLAESPIVRLPLAGTDISAGSTTVDLVSTTVPDRRECFTYWDRPTISLRDITVEFSGDESPPASIAGFLPPLLDLAVIAIPAEPTPVEITAATELAASLMHRYRAEATRIEVEQLAGRGQDPGRDSAFLARRFVIEEAAESTIDLATAPGGMPTLRMAGSGPGLETQVRVLTSSLAALAAAPSVSIAGEASRPRIAPEFATFQDLGLGSPRATGVGRVRLPLILDQTRIGWAVDDATLRLIGTYTPLSSAQGGQMIVALGDEVLDHWPMEASGAFDRTIEISGPRLPRFMPLTVSAEISGASLDCGLEQPVTVTLDPDSALTVIGADPPEPWFESLPQALLPSAHAGLGQFDFAHARRLIRIVSGLQALSATPLHLQVGTIDDALGSEGPKILIGASGVDLPLSKTGDAYILDGTAGTQVELALDPSQRYGSLQVATVDGDIALATDGLDASVDSILSWLESDQSRWFELTGNVLAAFGDDEPRSISVGITEDRGEEGGLLDGNGRILALVGIGALAVGGVAALGLALRRRSRR
ncbi:cellulose biosynthesis cyclic di-GMP-binding regulatory protein BcsB [Lolliginicoccus suaedae]|uniref:cellulose biosynthesis cyclic di-GMP-binding regulatory protein BcsB n=1 Tax=Lolliginicoccus suaedae TaxID=2605429 RepID=UPI0011EBB235|nr:cellulose biosynthesis cyclic di-GMP-binding regulatory protein BcsB [Lolliginicoccus suaedae]